MAEPIITDKDATQVGVDLFGNPRDTALDRLRARARQAMLDPRAHAIRRASIARRLAAVESGEVQDPEYESDKKRDETLKSLWADARDKGVTPDENPSDFASIAVSHFTRAGDARSAFMAIQWKQMQEANARAAELERAQIGKAGNQDKRGDFYSYVQDPELGLVATDARNPRVIDPVTKKEITKRVRKIENDPKSQAEIAGAKQYGQDVGKAVAAIGGKYDALDSVREAQGILRKGIYNGFWADVQKNVAAATPGVDKTKVANTEEFISYIGNTVVPRLKEFGGNDSNEELKYLQKIQGGEITMQDKALERILVSAEKKISAGIKRLRAEGKTIGKDVPESPEEKPQVSPKMIDELLKKYGKQKAESGK